MKKKIFIIANEMRPAVVILVALTLAASSAIIPHKRIPATLFEWPAAMSTEFAPLSDSIPFDYNAAWEKIDSLVRQGLPKSALEKTGILLEMARNEARHADFVKAQLYRGRFITETEEDGLEKAIQLLAAETEESAFPVRQLLHSITAELLSSYLNTNLYQLNSRTEVQAPAGNDISGWSVGQFQREIVRHYDASLNDERLKQSDIEEFTLLLTPGQLDENLRPTLFDFLAHRAIDYFRNDISHLTQPAYAFVLNDESALKPAAEFVNWDIRTQDTASFKLKALLLLQEILAFRLSQAERFPGALLDADLKRIDFVSENAVFEGKMAATFSLLESLRSTFMGKQEVAEVYFRLASLYHSEGNRYSPPPFGQPDSDERKWHFKTAVALCDEASREYPASPGANACRSLKNNILRKSLKIHAEHVNLPELPVLLRVDYANIDKFLLKVIRIDEKRRDAMLEAQMDSHSALMTYLNSLPSSEIIDFNLPDDGDFRRHSAEVKLEALSCGQYVLFFSSAPDFSESHPNDHGHLLINVSNLGAWSLTNMNDNRLVVFDRKQGKPLAGVMAEFWDRDYKYGKAKAQKSRVINALKSDENGFVHLPNDLNYRLCQVILRRQKDTLLLSNHFFAGNVFAKESDTDWTGFFLDRAIYRPGQTIYFKGIALRFDERSHPEVIANKKVTVTLTDANWQKVSTLQLTTNEYGTFNGSFTTPRTGITGQMHIKSSLGGQSKYFRVEEYKRPRFSVAFQPVSEAFRLNEQVVISGNAKSYAGSGVGGAKVSWRVVREARFPWYRWWRWGGFPQSSPAMEIANGIATTDETGYFKIDFKAIPDLKIPAADKPEFFYSVMADVTDINGETQSCNTAVVVGYVAMRVELSASGSPLNESSRDMASLQEIEISSKNLNGQFEPARGTISIEQLNSPPVLYKNRIWKAPDRRAMSEQEFKTAFPDLAWAGEDKVQNWPVGKQILNSNFDTEKSNKLHIPAGQLKPGWYLLKLSTSDRFGENVESRSYFSTYAKHGSSLPALSICTHNQGVSADGDDQFDPGENADLFFASSLKNQHVLLELEKDGEIICSKWLKINGLHKETLHVLETHRGNVKYSYSFASGNRSFNFMGALNIPWSNKDLTISYGTFRDKLAPGQQDEWVITVKGPKNEQVAAELAVAMYDMSLDAFAANLWQLKPWPISHSWSSCVPLGYDETVAAILGLDDVGYFEQPINRYYQGLNWFNWNFNGSIFMEIEYSKMQLDMMDTAPRGVATRAKAARENAPVPPPAADSAAFPEELEPPSAKTDFSLVDVRANLNETVFFYPQLMTDSSGNVVVRFTMNEALTKWKFLALAHTRNLQIATSTREVVTRKELMVVPNPPRFLRENDEFEFSAKVVNMTDTALSGEAKLDLANALTGEKLTWASLSGMAEIQRFTVEAGQSSPLHWKIKVPEVSTLPALEYTVIAVANDFSDAERNTAPVLTNRMLVTESLPMPVQGGQTKEFVFNSLKDNDSPTLKHEALTLEFTQNPAWYAVQALPYLMEYPNESSEQVFSRYFANSLGATLANRYPGISKVFDRWRTLEPPALESNLSKNEDLKSALLEETPWVLEAQSESRQKQNIGLLFDLNNTAYQREMALDKLSRHQLPSGAWSWFPDGPESWYITQYIAEGMGHLRNLGADSLRKESRSGQVVQNAVLYCDAKLLNAYERLELAVRNGEAKWEDDHLDFMSMHYLYMRSFYPDVLLSPDAQTARNYYLGQAQKYWNKKGLYMQAMLSLALHRAGEKEAAKSITRSLKERAMYSEELGMYWKYPRGWWWYEAPIETHSIMIEVFNEVAADADSVDKLKIWLLKNKQVSRWKTTKATAQAVYALLSTGENWLEDNQAVSIKIKQANSNQANNFNAAIQAAQQMAESGTGYFKARASHGEVSADLAEVEISNPNRVITWGALYWQYFEQLDRINSFEQTPLKIKRQLFRAVNTPAGEVLDSLKEGEGFKVGDKIMVRIELRVDRDMEYVHMKDMRAGGFEPVHVLSQYKWKGGLGYFESTRDAATNFFFSWLPKGTYVFEYPLRATYRGNFSTGTTSIQCMYAPEFTSHSQGGRVSVE